MQRLWGNTCHETRDRVICACLVRVAFTWSLRIFAKSDSESFKLRDFKLQVVHCYLDSYSHPAEIYLRLVRTDTSH